MPYFRVSDQFHNAPATIAAGNSAIGLWVRCGAYSANYLLDGFVPVEVAQAYGSRREIDRLVDTGLILHVAPAGLLIPEWTEHNFSADQVRAQRATERERQRRWRHAVTPPDVSRRDSRVPKPKPKPNSLAAAAMSTAVGANGDAAAAAQDAIDLYIAHKVAREQPRHPDAYRNKLRDEIPDEYKNALDEYTNAHPNATRNDVARAVFGMSIIDIRKAGVTP